MSEREDKKNWTSGEVLYHLNALRESDHELYQQRFAAQERAIQVAEANAEKWRQNANEWRAAMTDRERNFLSRGMGLVAIALGIAATLLTIFSYVRH